MEIRKMRNAEFDEVAKIAQEEIYSFLSLDQIKDWLNGIREPYLQIFVADNCCGEILGFIAWRLYDQSVDKAILEIFWMAIKKNFRKSGVGEELLKKSFEQVEKYWESQGKTISAILVAPYENRPGAQAFFAKILRNIKKTPLVPGLQQEIGQVRKILVPDVWGTDFAEKGIVIISKTLVYRRT